MKRVRELTFVAEVIPADTSITGGALGAGASVLIRSLSDPIAPEQHNAIGLDSLAKHCTPIQEALQQSSQKTNQVLLVI